ncbi:hypothetical protein M747DRAFT_30036 [Aspergillus niger ATCC 13496]|uniref:Uncharacterized protein n=1 Tax=Aspergillus niger ATCC 13496 TaxID=1353008 RepID=A0A370C3E1_ASPNG|nr:hypothetical protein M747DRAFT_30036 [Aspergillus niger ATCC 13496]
MAFWALKKRQIDNEIMGLLGWVLIYLLTTAYRVRLIWLFGAISAGLELSFLLEWWAGSESEVGFGLGCVSFQSRLERRQFN